MNIVWKRPDGGVSVTVFAPNALERMAWAAANAALLDDKIELVAKRAAQAQALGFVLEDLEKAARALDEGKLSDDERARRERSLEELMAKRVSEAAALADLDDKLEVVRQVEEVRDTMGLDAHGHELILRARGAVPADHVCVGHGLDVPVDRTFRDAWTFDGGAVVHDLDKAREIQKERMRTARVERFAELDGQWMKAMGQGDSAAAASVEAERQQLRDVTADPAIAKAATPEALAAVWPSILTE